MRRPGKNWLDRVDTGEQCVLWDLDERVGVDQPWGLEPGRVAAIQADVARLATGGRI